MNEAQSEYYDVDPTTDVIWKLMDGKSTVSEIFEKAKALDATLTAKDVKDTIVSLAEEGILASTEAEVQKKRVLIPSPFELDVHLLKDSSQSLAGFFRVTRRLIKRWQLPVAVAIAVLGFVLFYGSFIRIFADPSLFNLAGSAVLGFFFYQVLVLLPVYAIHELAHAAVCDYYGGKPHGMGTGLYYLAPFFYCDTSDAWRLSKRARIMISVAGPLSTVVISSLLVVWSFFVPPGFYQNVLQIGAFFGYYGSLINFSPVIETDGYYILADALEIPNLRDEAFSFFKRNLLRIFRRPVQTVRQGARRRKIIAIYTVFTFVWLAFFAYTTLWVMAIYGSAAYMAISGLGATILGTTAFDLTSTGVNVATLAYFALYLVGFVVMGVVASKKIRMKGIKLETIHSKRVSAFLPLPSWTQKSTAASLVGKARGAASSKARSFSVTLEPPLCVAAIKLGKVDQSLEVMRGEMERIEESFRTIHGQFISSGLGADTAPRRRAMADNIVLLARQFPPMERKKAISAAGAFVKDQGSVIRLLLLSAFGTVWTLEVSPGDYKRISREAFPSLVADDLGGAGLPGEVEQFKRHQVVGAEAIAQLAVEVEKESKEVHRAPEVYQVTALLEPIKSRLIFVGRTDRVEGSVVWLGGMFLYQAWASYIRNALQDSALGLKSLRLSRSSMTKTQATRLLDEELVTLDDGFHRFEDVAKTIEEVLPKMESTYESSVNFQQALDDLLRDEAFDVGLYEPILRSNEKHLEGLKEKIEEFRSEFAKVAKNLGSDASIVREERSRRAAEVGSKTRGPFQRLVGVFRGSGKERTAAFDSEVKMLYATARLVYGPAIGSDLVL